MHSLLGSRLYLREDEVNRVRRDSLPGARGIASGASPIWISIPSRTSTVLENRSRRSEEHTSELQSRVDLVCRLLLEKKKATGTACSTIAAARIRTRSAK